MRCGLSWFSHESKDVLCVLGPLGRMCIFSVFSSCSCPMNRANTNLWCYVCLTLQITLLTKNLCSRLEKSKCFLMSQSQ